MPHPIHPLLQETTPSLNHEKLATILSQQENILLIQDLDGVCMELVKNPLDRAIDPYYVQATKAFAGHFYVLTNGEHIGKRGVNRIIDRAFGDANFVRENALYLPGLAAGGVQWQDRRGNISHPGVTAQELTFLAQVPQRLKNQLEEFFAQQTTSLSPTAIQSAIEASIVDQVASPTANLNTLYEALSSQPQVYWRLQQTLKNLMETLLKEAQQQGLTESFFVHYAPNLGRDETGKEILRPVQDTDSGTTDFQFMLRGAIKEAGVLSLLNHYYYQRTGHYPLGKSFSVRQASADYSQLRQFVYNSFDPEIMPLIVGVGDTVNSSVTENHGKLEVRRGGSDRAFLQLIQDIHPQNIVVYIDSSGGEVKNRQPVAVETTPTGEPKVISGPCDPRDTADPLQFDMIFPQGPSQYTAFFRDLATHRLANKLV